MTNSRRKGHDFERKLVKALRENFPSLDARRGYQYRGGKESPDLVAGPFWIEAKCGKRPNIHAAYSQACDDNNDLIPIAVTKQDYGETLVTLSWRDFIDILRHAEAFLEKQCRTK